MSQQIPENQYYTKQHEWAREDNGLLVIGITDYAQNSLGDIVFVDVGEPGQALDTDGAFGTIESVKAAEDLYAPVSGTIAEINEEVKQSPEKINADANSAWLVKIKDYDAEALKGLMDAAAYSELVSSL